MIYILYDEACGLAAILRDWLEARLPSSQYTFLKMEHPLARDIRARHNLEPDFIYWVENFGTEFEKVLNKSTAFFTALSVAEKTIWSKVGWQLLGMPPEITDPLFEFAVKGIQLKSSEKRSER